MPIYISDLGSISASSGTTSGIFGTTVGTDVEVGAAVAGTTVGTDVEVGAAVEVATGPGSGSLVPEEQAAVTTASALISTASVVIRFMCSYSEIRLLKRRTRRRCFCLDTKKRCCRQQHQVVPGIFYQFNDEYWASI